MVCRVTQIENLDVTTRYHSVGDPNDSSPDDQKRHLIENLTQFWNGRLRVEGNLSERVVYLLQSYEAFDKVSNNDWAGSEPPPVGFGSLEDVHNAVHGIVGGYGRDGQGRQMKGHMGSVPISSFDPIFWLHHT